MEEYRKVVTKNGTTNYLPAARVAAIVAQEKAEQAAKKEDPTGTAHVITALDRMDIKELDTETVYYAHVRRGVGATKVTEYSTEEPKAEEPKAAAAPAGNGLDILELAKAIQSLNAAPAEDAKPKGRPKKEAEAPAKEDEKAAEAGTPAAGTEAK